MIVSGQISQDTTWKAGSDVSIDGTVEIGPDATLTIEPGVTVNGGTIQTFGKLVANGTPLSSISFKDVSLTFSSSYDFSGQIEVSFAKFTGGAFLPATGNASLGSFKIYDSLFIETTGFYIWYPTSESIFKNNVFFKSQGISTGTRAPNTIEISNNVFISNTGAINSGKAAISNWASYDDPKLVQVVNNSFFLVDDAVALELEIGYSSSSIFAESNYFGTKSIKEVENLILDANDSFNRASAIEFEPILTSAPIEHILKAIQLIGPDTFNGTSYEAKINFALTEETFFGTDGDDFIFSNDNNNVIVAGDGDDTVVLYEGDNRVWAGANDTGDDLIIIEGSGNNITGGGPGNDTIEVNGHGNNTLFGGADDDELFINGDGKNTAWAGTGEDLIEILGNGDNTVGGGADNDTIRILGDGDNIVYGGTGSDLISVSGNGDNLIFGGGLNPGGGMTSNEIFITGSGANEVFNGAGDDVVIIGHGATGDNLLWGGAGDDLFNFVDPGAKGIVAFTSGNDHDSISGFNLSSEHYIDLSNMSDVFSSAADVHAAISSTEDGGAVITVAPGQSVTIDIAAADLIAANPDDWLIL